MTEQEYGDEFKGHLLEQYKLYVQMADNISERRAKTNQFYISLLSAILVLVAIFVEKTILEHLENAVFFAVGVLGIFLCVLWYVNILSYRQLNSGKFKVIHELEGHLPFPCYGREWEKLGRGKESKKYFRLTRVEAYIPLALGMPYAVLLIYVVVQWVS